MISRALLYTSTQCYLPPGGGGGCYVFQCVCLPVYSSVFMITPKSNQGIFLKVVFFKDPV